MKFKEFYQFTFNYAKNPSQKGLDLEMALAYWNIVMAGRFKFLGLWSTFLRWAIGQNRFTISGLSSPGRTTTGRSRRTRGTCFWTSPPPSTTTSAIMTRRCFCNLYICGFVISQLVYLFHHCCPGRLASAHRRLRGICQAHRQPAGLVWGGRGEERREEGGEEGECPQCGLLMLGIQSRPCKGFLSSDIS